MNGQDQRHTLGPLGFAVPVFLLVGCAAASDSGAAEPGSGEPHGSADPEPNAGALLTEEFPYGRFGDPTTIDNHWLPLVPGTTRTWEGETVEGDEAAPHRVVMSVTDLTKVIDGVETVVIVEQDFSDDELVEAEIAFIAQDDEGAVWHLGQYPEEYEDGEFVAAPGWIAGEQGAMAGYWMTADPQVGVSSYSQGWGPEVSWTDRGRVIDTGVEACFPIGCYDDVIVVEEWALDEPGATQLKYYAGGVGNVRVGWSGSPEQEQETLDLVEHSVLAAEELDAIRAEALGLEARAYEILPDLYGATEPMQRRPR